MEVYGIINQENGPKAEKDKTERVTKRGDIEKWDQIESPEIPDRGETEIPGLPSGVAKRKRLERNTICGVVTTDETTVNSYA